MWTMTGRDTRRRGVEAVADELNRRGAGYELVSRSAEGHHVVCRTTTGTWRLRLKTKSTGTWQDDTRNGARATVMDADDSAWIYVDLGEQPPTFYVAPGWWAVNDIYSAHSGYLAKHGGRRAVNPTATHHAIRPRRIEEWRNRWDVIGL